MADVTITAANVLEATGGKVKRGVAVAGEPITAGQTFYEKTEGLESKLKKAFLTTNESTEKAKATGMALCNAGTNQPFVFARDGVVELGSDSLTPAMSYFISDTAGKICPSTDIATAGEYITLFGLAIDSSRLLLINEVTGEQVVA